MSDFVHKSPKLAMLKDTPANMVPKAHIEAGVSVTPLEATYPRQTRQVTVKGPLGSATFGWHYNFILYYEAKSDEESGWLVGGWSKEALGRALVEQPILSGRLSGGVGGDGEVEIVSNDSGIRLLEARMGMSLAEFMEVKGREEAEAEAEAKLVFWKDIDELSSQFSPLCYVQVTNFLCGGYSMGVCCSPLLADPLVITTLLKKWAYIHKTIVSNPQIPKTPTFYLPNLKPSGGSPFNIIGSNPLKDRGQSMIFKIATKNYSSHDEHMVKTMALLCIDEMERKIDVKMTSTFSLFVKELNSENLKIEKCSKQVIVEKPTSVINGANWDDLGACEVAFHDENRPKCVSYWMNLASDEGIVMVIPSPDEGISGMNVIVTIPNEQKI